MPRVSFSTLGCPDWTWHDVLRRGPELGFDGTEIRLLARETDLTQVPDLRPTHWATRRRELTECGFAVCGLSSSVRFDEPEVSQRETRLDSGRRYVDMAAALGASFVRVFGDVLPPGSDAATEQATIETIAECINRLGEHAAASGVGIVIETHGDFADSSRMARLMGLVHSPAVGVLWDTHHPWRFFGEPLATTFDRLRRWIRHTHWKDSVTNPTTGQEHESDDRRAERVAASAKAHATNSGHRPAHYVAFGAGEFPIGDALRLLAACGYTGWHSLEWEKAWHPELAEPEVAFPQFVAEFRRRAAMAGVQESSQNS